MKKLLSVFELLFFLSTLYSPVPKACPLGLLSTSLSYGDEIKIRTIVTPMGSQSEKWGAKGLMVCIGGETIANGGCATEVTGGFVARKGGGLGDVDEVTDLIKTNDVVIFEDVHGGSSFGKDPNHEYSYDSGDEDESDVVAVNHTVHGVGFRINRRNKLR